MDVIKMANERVTELNKTIIALAYQKPSTRQELQIKFHSDTIQLNKAIIKALIEAENGKN